MYEVKRCEANNGAYAGIYAYGHCKTDLEDAVEYRSMPTQRLVLINISYSSRDKSFVYNDCNSYRRTSIPCNERSNYSNIRNGAPLNDV